MKDPLFSYSSNELIYPVDDNNAIDIHGNLYMRMPGDNMLFNFATGKIEYTSGWPEDRHERDSFDGDDFDGDW